jgi:hypothetical protein
VITYLLASILEISNFDSLTHSMQIYLNAKRVIFLQVIYWGSGFELI